MGVKTGDWRKLMSEQSTILWREQELTEMQMEFCALVAEGKDPVAAEYKLGWNNKERMKQLAEPDTPFARAFAMALREGKHFAGAYKEAGTPVARGPKDEFGATGG